MNRSLIIQVLLFFGYLFVQVILLRNISLFNTAFCFLYIAYILSLPIDYNRIVLMVIAFLMGFLVDIFYDSLGMHTSALVAVAFVRNNWLYTIAPQGGYDAGPTLTANGLQWFLVYSIPLVAFHHLLLFFIEAGGFSMVGFTLAKAFSSMAFTLFVMLLLQYLVIARRR